MLLFVSGEDTTTMIDGFLNESVRLPCDCSGRTSERFWWQKDDRVKNILFKNNTVYKVNEKYNETVSLLYPEDSSKCDILLTSITAEDSGKYRCAFEKQGYTINFVNLTVFATYNICRRTVNEKVFLCDVKGRYGEAEILWRLDGDFLKNSTTDSITHDYSWDPSSHLHQLHSEFSTNRNLTARPSCHVEAKYKFLQVNEICEPERVTGLVKKSPPNSWKSLAIIPIALAFGVFLYLCHRFRSSWGRQEHDFYEITEIDSDSMTTLPGLSSPGRLCPKQASCGAGCF